MAPNDASLFDTLSDSQHISSQIRSRRPRRYKIFASFTPCSFSNRQPATNFALFMRIYVFTMIDAQKTLFSERMAVPEGKNGGVAKW